jgi:hypothetical protein
MGVDHPVAHLEIEEVVNGGIGRTSLLGFREGLRGAAEDLVVWEDRNPQIGPVEAFCEIALDDADALE